MSAEPRSRRATSAHEPAAYAASHSQRRLWVLQEMDPGSTAYNLPGAILLEGPLDVASLKSALEDLIDRHESLRTTFAVRGDQVCQLVHSTIRPYFEEFDLRSVSDPEGAARQLATENSSQPFDLRQGPLLRAKLLRLAPEKHVLAYNLHHIISDDASNAVLVRELDILYSARVAGMPNPLPALDFQYRDFAAWQNRELSGPEAAGHRQYWLDKFAGELPTLELAPDFPRPPIKTFSGRCLVTTWEPQFLERLVRFAQAEKTTLFLLLLALVRVQLFRYTHQPDIAIGTAVEGRDEPELENQIGFYANTLPLRQTIHASDSFRSVLSREKETFTSAYDHQFYPFDQLVTDLNVRRDLSRAPVFEVSIYLQNTGVEKVEIGNLRVSDFVVETSAAKLDLSYNFVAGVTGLQCGLTYNTTLFGEERIGAMHRHLRQLAEEAVRDPQCRIGRFRLLAESERTRLFTEFNKARTAWREVTIVDLFEAEVARRPEAEAVVDGEIRLTFAELNRRANQLAHYLIDQGVGLETRVAAFLERSAKWIVAVLGIMKAGAVYLPLNPHYPLNRIEQLLTDARPPVILTDSNWEDHLPAYFAATVISLDLQWDDEIALAPAGNLAVALLPRNGAYLIYTSGSTGQPKGVLVEHGGFTNMIRDQIERFGVRPEDRGLQFASISYDASMYELFLALLAGACVAPIPRAASTDADSFGGFLEAQRITMATLSPSFLRTVGAQRLASIRLIITAGEAAAPEVCTEIARTRQCVNAYGPTEVSVCASCHNVEADGDYRLGVPIGRPVSNDRLYIVDPALNPVPVGVPGELCVGGAGLARGYIGKPDSTAEVFIPDPFGPDAGARLYRTGDIARWRQNGEIEFLGRKDHQVKVRGHRVELGELETALNQLSGVREAVAAVYPGPDGNQRLVAYLVAVNGSIPASTLRAQLLKMLPESLVPDTFVELSSLPLNAAGKIDRRALQTLENDMASDRATLVEPRTDLERILAGVYAKVIGLSQVGVHDSFFDLGGNSLMATQAVSRIRDLLRVDFSVPALFESPRIEDLAARLLREHAAPDQLEKIARVITKFESLSEEEKSAVLTRARERAGKVTA
jgi:amino acid adenylation domain-containing protein